MGERRRKANGRHTLSNDRVPADPVDMSKIKGQMASRPIRNVCVYCGSSPGHDLSLIHI